MLGVLVNTVAIFIGGFFGLMLKKGISNRFREIIMQAVGLAVIFTGVSGAIGGFIKQTDDHILFIICLVIGSVIGEWINIDSKLKNLGVTLEKKFGEDGNIANGFVSASLIFCVGAMAILGSFESGINNNHTTLYAKSVLDGITALILATSLGTGVILSGIVVLIYQGALALLSGFIAPYLSVDAIREMSIIGNILITTIGLDLLNIVKIKYANMIPAVFLPVIYFLFKVA